MYIQLFINHLFSVKKRNVRGDLLLRSLDIIHMNIGKTDDNYYYLYYK